MHKITQIIISISNKIKYKYNSKFNIPLFLKSNELQKPQVIKIDKGIIKL